MVKLFDVSHLEQRIKGDFDEIQYEESVKANLKQNHGKLPEEERKKTTNEEDWESDSDMSDDSDEPKKKSKKKNKQLNPKNPTLQQSKKMAED
jgi:hypothetical protein